MKVKTNKKKSDEVIQNAILNNLYNYYNSAYDNNLLLETDNSVFKKTIKYLVKNKDKLNLSDENHSELLYIVASSYLDKIIENKFEKTINNKLGQCINKICSKVL